MGAGLAHVWPDHGSQWYLQRTFLVSSSNADRIPVLACLSFGTGINLSPLPNARISASVSLCLESFRINLLPPLYSP